MAKPDALLTGLNEVQAQVASTFGCPVAVIAGPGTGKTRAITHRIAYGALTGALDPGHTLAVSFTTRAAAELRERVAQLGVPQVTAATFHSAALRQARYFWPEVFGTELPQVSADGAGLLAAAVQRQGLELPPSALRAVLGEVSWAKVSNVLPDDYPQLAAQYHREVPEVNAYEVAKLLLRYEQVKAEAGVIDFDDILLCACALLSENPGVRNRVLDQYRHLVVDEFQDVNPLQRTLLDLWLDAKQPDLCVVGDPAQTIHSYAGARADYLKQFPSAFPEAKLFYLDADYRSTRQIVELANRVARHNLIPGAVTLRAEGGAGPQVEVVGHETEAAEADALGAWLASLDLPWRSTAVLYRARTQAEPIAQALKAQGIPYVVRSEGSTVEDYRPRHHPDAVTLATLHSAKGLEWEAVAIAGVQEGTLPHALAESEAEIAEEARLLYVGVTRARSRLLLSWAARRQLGSALRRVSPLLPTMRAT
ncbi:MAG: ATP-dependent helicase [Propionibacteriaceae bacterium]|nr:ATP-dependent helicase [Propionibacteriaceae bacterium]